MLRFVYIDGYPFPMYSIMAFFGAMFVVVVGISKHKALGLRKRDIVRLVAYATIGAILGAKLFSVIGQIINHGTEPDFWTTEHLLHIASGGGVFYGGLLGAVGAAVLRSKIGHLDLNRMFNFAAYAALAFQCMGRIGCYCAGCCYGVMQADGTRFPIQLIEAGYCFVALLAFLIVKPERRWPSLPLFPVYIIIYSVGRFGFEFLRGDANRGRLWMLSTSQWIALILIALAVIWLIKSYGIFTKKAKTIGGKIHAD